MGRSPDLSGEVSDFDQNKVGRISLWMNDRGNERQPDYTGSVSFRNGEEKFRVAVWKQGNGEERGEGKESTEIVGSVIATSYRFHTATEGGD